MPTKRAQDIANELLTMTDEDVRHISAACSTILGVKQETKPPPPKGVGGDFWEAGVRQIAAHTGQKPGTVRAWSTTAKGAPLLRSNLDAIDQWVWHCCKGLSRVQRRALLNLFWHYFMNTLKERGITTMDGIARSIPQMPLILDNHFPGYGDAGLWSLLVRPHNERVKL